MHMNIKITILCGALLCFGGEAFAKQFVLPKQKVKKLSRNELKEAIGQEIRDAFTLSTNIAHGAGVCQVSLGGFEDFLHKKRSTFISEDAYLSLSPLQKSLGAWHMEIAVLQQKFSQLIERLVDNQKPFKKASRVALDDAWVLMQNVKCKLKEHADETARLNKQLANVPADKLSNKLAVFKNFTTMAQDAVAAVQKMGTQMNRCEGLKIA